jgi:hypothetical protein
MYILDRGLCRSLILNSGGSSVSLWELNIELWRVDAEASTGAVGTDKDFVELGSVELVMAGAVAEAEALEPMSLEEAWRRKDWLKWNEGIKVELDALKKAGTWGIVERLRGQNIVESKWVF